MNAITNTELSSLPRVEKSYYVMQHDGICRADHCCGVFERKAKIASNALIIQSA